MRAQLDNKVMSSFYLWLDHTILTKGEAFTNFSGLFYKISTPYYPYDYTYALPFKQIIADNSIVGANIMSGIYINGNYIQTGQSGLVAINYDQGQVIFSQNVDSARLSGNYAVKDYNVSIATDPEQKLLFETKYETRPKTQRQITGLGPQTLTYPIIFLKNEGSINEPFAFGGTDTTVFNIRAITISDSQFSLDALCSILRDKVRTYIPLIPSSSMPYNFLGDTRNNNYNYLNLPSEDNIFISKVNISHLTYQSVIMNEIKNLNPNIFPTLIDFELEIVREPRI